MNHSIEPFIHRKVVALAETSTAFQASKAMCENQVGCVVVSDKDGHISGILTDRDVACGLVAMNFSPDTRLSELVTKQLIWVGENTTIEQVVQLMRQFGIRRVPVVHQGKGGKQRCIGLVSLDDIIASESISVEELAQVVRSQIRGYFNPDFAREKTIPDSISKEFLATLSRKASLTLEQAQVFTKFTFGAIVRRLHYTGAVQFIHQVPRAFQQELFGLKAGPDRSIDAQYLIAGTSAHLRMTASEAKEVLRKFWSTLLQYTSKISLDHVMSQLPEEIRELFTEEPESMLIGPAPK